jgi:hypothetical protein
MRHPKKTENNIITDRQMKNSQPITKLKELQSHPQADTICSTFNFARPSKKITDRLNQSEIIDSYKGASKLMCIDENKIVWKKI